jgi:glycine cleavage system H lipoate-binding protein
VSNDNRKEKRKGRLIPNGELKCLWMEAGVVSYKLCDHQYECERCPFDQILRKNAHESLARHIQAGQEKVLRMTPEKKEATKATSDDSVTTDFDHLFQRFSDVNIEEGLFYHPGHTWMDVEGPQSVRIGLDDFVVKFLPGVTSIILPSVQNRIDRGYICCWVVEREGILPITAPISGSVIATNRRISTEPSLLLKSPYGQGWLMKIEPESMHRDLKHLYKRNDMLVHCSDDLKKLRGTFETLLKQNWENVGQTLCDGGNMLVHIRDVIGSKRYFDTINSLLTKR